MPIMTQCFIEVKNNWTYVLSYKINIYPILWSYEPVMINAHPLTWAEMTKGTYSHSIMTKLLSTGYLKQSYLGQCSKQCSCHVDCSNWILYKAAGTSRKSDLWAPCKTVIFSRHGESNYCWLRSSLSLDTPSPIY